LNNTAARWLSLRLQIYGTVLVFSVCVAGVYLSMNNFVGAGLLGLAITYAMNLTDTLAQVNRESADRETQMVSVERVDNYATDIPKEDALLTSEGNDPAWMSLGNITAENVKMKYREHLPYVLNGISLKIQAGERVGIVGRTGCGKSSFLTALMRLVEIQQDGQFSIDGLDLKKVGLHTLRSRVAIIPQDPAILTGTIRFNLDPFGKETDEDLWAVLEKSQLRPRVEDAGGLDSIVRREVVTTRWASCSFFAWRGPCSDAKHLPLVAVFYCWMRPLVRWMEKQMTSSRKSSGRTSSARPSPLHTGSKP